MQSIKYYSTQRISCDLWRKLGELNIKKRVRGSKAGSHKVRPIQRIIGHRGLQKGLSSEIKSVNYNNLVQIKTQPSEAKDTLNTGFFNARSVCNKASELAEFITDNKLDICGISETWLTNEDRDSVICGSITPKHYKLQLSNRKSGKDGGLAVVYKASMKCKKQKVEEFKTFEILELILFNRGDTIRLCIIYKPPKGSKYGGSLTLFREEFQRG
ncbi:hypothetical protein SNE40_019897 [Patella caerulea]|uniref:Uncharacterized protein n=1 Tax=Patella caerulea TaxID=87958 RepID=A0AAN8IZZ3_PATCE